MRYKEAEKKYKALANRRRLAIIYFLSKESKMDVGSISQKIRLSFKSTSRHLQILKSVGLIDSEQVGLEHYYYLPNKNEYFIKHALKAL